MAYLDLSGPRLEHFPKKWEPVFRPGSAQDMESRAFLIRQGDSALPGKALALAGASPSAGAADAVHFDAFERAVIGLARHDAPTSLSEPGRVRRAIERFFKIHRGNRLADPRLEALRRMAILLRRGLGSADEAERFLASGYSRDQLAALTDHIGDGAR